MKKFIRITGIVLAALVVVGISAFFIIKAQKVPDLPVSDVDLSAIADGTYTGEYSQFPVIAAVEVTVKGHKITGITITKHENGLGKPAEKITEDIIRSQSLQVDAVSGATHSSNVIRKAVEVALNNR